MGEDYASIDKAQLITMIHFLEKRDEEQKQENQELKELMKELQETHNQKVKSQADLLSSIDRLTKQVANLTEDNKKLQQQIDELLNKIKKKQSSLTINRFKGRNPIGILSYKRFNNHVIPVPFF